MSADDPQKGAAPPAQPQVMTLAQTLATVRELQKNGRLEQARQVAQAAIRAVPGSAEAHRLAGATELAAGRPDLALPLLQRAVGLDAANPDGYRTLGGILKALGRDGEAAGAFEQALKLLAARPPSTDALEINRTSPTHHLQARPLNHARFRRSESFERLIGSWLDVRSHTVDNLARLYFLADNVAHTLTRGVQGALVELGVWRGHSAKVMRAAAPGRMLYLLDTFQGFAPGQLPEGDPRRDLYRDTSLEAVRRFVGTDEVVYCAGLFPETASQIPAATRFAVVHIDGGLGETARLGLEHFYPRLNPGGLMIVHDYGNDGVPDVALAVDAFLADKPEGLVIVPDRAGTAVLVKR